MQTKTHNKGKTIKELISSFILFLIIASTVLLLVNPALAENGKTPSSDPKPPASTPSGSDIPSLTETLTKIGQQSSDKKEILPGFGTSSHADASYEQGASNITSAIFSVVDLIKYFVGTIAVVVIIISGIRLITAGKNIEEVATKQKENIKYAVFGLILIIIADVMVQQVFFGETGEIFRTKAELQAAAERGTEQVRGIYTVISMFAASMAILMIVFSGVRLVTSGGNEEVIGKQKKTIMYAVLGLILVGVAEVVVKDIIFPDQGAKLSDTGAAARLVVDITNFVSGFVATIAIAMLMYGGFLYVTAAGGDENLGKAKKVFLGAGIGLLVALGAFAIVNTFIRFEPPVDEGTVTVEMEEVGVDGIPIAAP